MKKIINDNKNVNYQPHIPNDEEPLKKIWCNRDDRYETIVVCLYRCPDKINCPSYCKHYDEIVDYDVPEKYISKYGAPERPEPKILKRRRKTAAKEAKAQDKLNKAAAKEKKQKEKKKMEKVKEKKRKEKTQRKSLLKGPDLTSQL